MFITGAAGTPVAAGTTATTTTSIWETVGTRWALEHLR
jgi:hypothetical protein